MPAGRSQLTVSLTGGSGDADLYVRYGQQPTTGSYDCRPYVGGNNETCTANNPTSGYWYIMIYAYTSYGGAMLRASY
ncbi:MAG: PPC domain-containing protein [Acidobacteria bacterium]|nr:PPC domain-containing protein [Acidobacteriota bacterium]